MPHNWSPQQNAIFAWFRTGTGNLVVRARAGTGKTTTIIEGIEHAPEARILLVAFGAEIAAELKTRIRNPKASARTLHSLGFHFVREKDRGIKVEAGRGRMLARKVLRETTGETNPARDLVELVAAAASKAKGMAPFAKAADMVSIMYAFDLVPEPQYEEAGFTVEVLAGLAVRAMELACEYDGTVDYDDQIFLPVRLGWVRPLFDMVIVDEAQDMNAAQLLLAQKVCTPKGRIVVVGDDRQAIYAFRGADSGSIDRLKVELSATELPLNVTYRCPRLVVEMAQEIVPDYQAAPEAPEGEISEMSISKIVEAAEVGNFILSRINAPLARICLALMRAGKKAFVRGRKDIGQGLVNLVKKLEARSMEDLWRKLGEWERTMVERLARQENIPESKIEFIHDQAETVRELGEDVDTVDALIARIESCFSDNHIGNSITLSSVHRAKGLEADKVFLLEDTLYPGGRENDEEKNIHYVGLTRAKAHLVMVAGRSLGRRN
jgi:DNA helicase-2/ATP-dependent DNA helicase PcrA